ncbi:putative Heme chaperone HemW [Pillotina sp. SPG140]|jgi:oxygen-independent coproporphyrinogen-3 oxidase
MIASLYVHVPFCANICDYCDFYSTLNLNFIEPYLQRVQTDIQDQLHAYSIESIPTVFIGGGTPSILGPHGIERLLKSIPFEPDIEVTVEANPESLSYDFLSACHTNGVNRLSVGVQTLNERSLDAVHRIRTGDILKKLALVQTVFPDSFSVDLMSGLPFQTVESLCADINTVCSFNPAHISLYALTQETQPDNTDYADELYCVGQELLRQSYSQYEVSNFAKKGKRCMHNVRYWRMEPWLGVGPSASGTLIDDSTATGVRNSYKADIEAYIRGEAPLHEPLDYLTLMKETVLMGFRYIDGVDTQLFSRRFKLTLEQCIPSTLERWKPYMKDGALTSKGLLMLNRFLTEAFIELEQ